MKQYLIDKKAEIKKLKVEGRELNFLKTKAVTQAIIGPRRSGKSFSIFYWIKTQNLKEEDYLLINFEDDEVKSKRREEKTKVINYHIETYNQDPKYIFLDEIHALDRWESFLYSLIEKKKYYIFVTGSSSKLLSKEIATQLRGRSITKVILPFNFREYLKLVKFRLSKYPPSTEFGKVKYFLQKFLLSGGYPQVIIDKLPYKVFFKDYLDLIIFKDLVERYRIENIPALRYLITKILASFSKEFSLNKVYRELNSMGMKVGKGTLYTYASYLEEILVVFFLKRFYFSEKKSQLSIPKVYICDNGLPIYLIPTETKQNVGRLMENMVAIELKKRELEEKIYIFYWKDHQGREVDFVVKDGLKIKQLIQVTYASSKDEIEKREIKSLLKASDKLNCKNLLIITWDYNGEEKIEDKKIKFVPLWRWLLKREAAV
jgi:hypothetical protein